MSTSMCSATSANVWLTLLLLLPVPLGPLLPM
jgi:hypothetical protein